MTLLRLIAPQWLIDQKPGTRRVIEGIFTPEQIRNYNAQGYNVYYLPNAPAELPQGRPIDGTDITEFKWVFVDYDLKSGAYTDKDAFITTIGENAPIPSLLIDSGNGVHCYWRVDNLDAMSYLRFQRRLIRLLRTDEAVGQIFQLMRLPDTLNTKDQKNPKPCEIMLETDEVYTAEQLDRLLPPITLEDEKYCQTHHDRTYGVNQNKTLVQMNMPVKWGQLLRDNHEVKELWSSQSSDRSKSDYRLAHLMHANEFTREEAMTVLSNTAKALQRAPIHQIGYAENIVDKIWTFEITEDKSTLDLSDSVADILRKSGDALKGVPFRCHKRIDNTAHGFRLGQVIGLVAGSGVGKTAFSMNMFQWFAQQNPDYHHFFVPLEQPANEIADRWRTMCGNDSSLHSKVHVISNYGADGTFRHLSFDEIKAYILKWQKSTGNKIGCIVVDHIGALKKKGKDGENQDLMTICHQMKGFAVETNTLLVMQSQSSRQKAGIGDIELDKDAAYGTVYFESYCDYLISIWQPLKRCHSIPECPTVTAFKFCKIRHKKARQDVIKEDVPYYLSFDSETELLNDMTQDQKTSFDYFLKQATSKRKQDKSELISYQSVPYQEGVVHAKPAETNSNRQPARRPGTH